MRERKADISKLFKNGSLEFKKNIDVNSEEIQEEIKKVRIEQERISNQVKESRGSSKGITLGS